MPQNPRTRPSTRKLSDLARHVIVPENVASTGWPAVRDTLANLDIVFDDWQEGAARLILSKSADGQYATTVGGANLSIPRQVGKTYMVGWIAFALCIIVPDLTVVWTAHRAPTAGETFDDMKSMASIPKMSSYVARMADNGSEQKIEFTNGSRVVFGARERGFGRGFTKLDVVVFDEAQILTERAIDDMVPAQNASPNALTVMIGTPPKPIDSSEIFEEARRAALAGEAPDSLYVEFSADREADPDDRRQWRKANPSYPGRTNENSMLRMKRKLTADGFRREALGIWDEMSSKRAAFSHDSWDDLSIENPDKGWPVVAYGVDMNLERTKVSIGVAMQSEDGVHLEIAIDAPFDEAGTSALVDWLWERCRRRIPIVVDMFSPARDVLETSLKAKKAMIRVLTSSEYVAGCALLAQAVEDESSVTHFAQDQLDGSVKTAFRDPIKNRPGSYKWNRITMDDDLSPLVAITCAHFGALKFSGRRSSAPEKVRGAIVF